MQKTILFCCLSISFAIADPMAHAVGIGGRAAGMADNFTAVADDYSSAYWNPAGLAFVPVREFHCAMEYDRDAMSGENGSTATEAEGHRWRISSAGLLRSVPTVRGGFALALGFSSPYLLDDVVDMRGKDVYLSSIPDTSGSAVIHAGDTLDIDRNSHSEKGGCYLWNAALGWQIAPLLGFGFTLGLLLGGEDRTIDRFAHDPHGIYEDIAASLARAYIGYDLRFGLLYKPSDGLVFGCRIELPKWAHVSEEYVDQYRDTVSTGALRSSFAGALAAALKLPYGTISLDVTARAPLAGASAGTDASYWKAGIGAGIEAPLKWISSVVRGGIRFSEFDPSPMQIAWDGSGAEAEGPYAVISNNRLIAAGYSLFLGTAFSLDMAYANQIYAFSSSDPRWLNVIVERHSIQRVVLTASVRY